jgi:CRISPR-associated protein Cas2
MSQPPKKPKTPRPPQKRGRPPAKEYSLAERLALVRAAVGTGPPPPPRPPDGAPLDTLAGRVAHILGLVQQTPKKATDMFHIIMYDIENNRVRREVAKYLLAQGCIRVQRSVYFARLKPGAARKIWDDLKAVQAAYDNEDSIILAPVDTQSLGSMKVVGKDLQIEILTERPNTLFF